MAKRLFAILLLVIISSVCIAAEEYKRRGWYRKIDTPEVYLEYKRSLSKDSYKLTVKCSKDDKKLEVYVQKEESGQVLYLVEIIEAVGFNQQQSRLGCPGRVSSLFEGHA